MFNRQESRPYYKTAPNLKADLGLGRNARGHLAETNGCVGDYPFVEKLHNVHGEEAKQLAGQLKSQGVEAVFIREGRIVASENPNPVHPARVDWCTFMVHRHPSSR